MNNLIALIAALLPQLIDYFKKKPVNAVTGAAGGSLLTLVLLAMQSPSYDQFITFLQNNGDTGIIAAATIAALRTLVFVYTASKGK